MIDLRGSTWDHERGFAPLQATAEAYMRLHPDIQIHWDKRTLRDFAELSVLDLAAQYDLIVLDHPWIGAAVARGSLLPLDQHLDSGFLSDQAANSVGKSHASYQYEGHQWALAIDAAAQVSTYRPDLVEQLDIRLPQTWDEVLTLAQSRKAHGGPQVAIPLMHVDCVPTFVSLCNNLGEAPMQNGEYYVSRPVGREVLRRICALLEVAHPASIRWNPPQMFDHMSRTDEIVYCPLAFGYTNYARCGYRPKLIRYANIPLNNAGAPAGAILGGAGLAVSTNTRHISEACAYAAYVASPNVQRTLYLEHEGQPGHRLAWLDAAANTRCANFFTDTLTTLDQSYMRPRYDGYIALQDAACVILHQFLTTQGDMEQTLNALDQQYCLSLRSNN